jgi:hypothetical protein
VFIATLAPCASVAEERAMLAGTDDAAGDAAHPAIPPDAGRWTIDISGSGPARDHCSNPEGGHPVPSGVMAGQ